MSRRYGPLFVCSGLLLLLLCCPASAAEKETKWLLPRTNVTGPSPNDYECESARAPDYYGIGVRLGIYFSWFTGWVANAFVPGDIGGALDTNAIFLFANLVAMVRCTITKVLTQLDCVILMHLSGGTVFSVLSLWGYRTCHYEAEGPKGIRHFGGFGTHLRLLLAMAVSVFGLWFWVVGIKPHTTDVVTDSGPCATVYTFMFAKVRADAGVRILYLIACISCVIYFGIMLLISTISLYARVAKGAALAKQGRWRTSTRLHYATGLYHKELRRLFYFLRVANFLWIVWSMITVECTLNFNHVKGVLGPGNRIFFPSQLIPMIIGAFSFVRLGYKLLEKWRDPDDEPSLPQDAHTSMFTDPENSERSQAFPSKSRMFKLFAPPTDTLNHAPKEAPPEDNDIDDLMRDKPPRLRYLVSWLPWLSLLHRWKKDADRLNFHRRWTNQERGRSYSPATTLQGTPVSTNFVNPYMAQIPD